MGTLCELLFRICRWYLLNRDDVAIAAIIQSLRAPNTMTTDSTFQFSLRTLFFATVIAGMNAAASVSGDMWMISLNLIATSFLVSLVLVDFFRFRSLSAASVGFFCCVFHCVLWGAFQSAYLLVFANERAMASIGLGNPISNFSRNGRRRLGAAIRSNCVSVILDCRLCH